MSRSIRVSPGGQLIADITPEAVPAFDDELAAQVDAAFGTSSADGILCLVSSGLGVALPPTLVFWRDFGQRFFQSACHLGEQLDWNQLESLTLVECESLVALAPPMRGLEYLSGCLPKLWGELQAVVAEQAAQHPDGPQAYLGSINPLWRLLGRVTLHLAENKRDERRPFAFLATYTQRVSSDSRLQHVPLAQALKEYAGTKNRSRLTALLEPVRRAAEQSTLIRQLLDSRQLFQPQAWSIRQAHDFLKESPQLETAGLVIRLPDWWHAQRPPRPQVQVQLGKNPTSSLGLDGVLDFHAELCLDGEPLTEAERRQVLEASEGLVLLRGRWVEVNQQQIQQALDHWTQLGKVEKNGISFIRGMRLLAGTQLEAESSEDETASWSQVVAGDWLREMLASIRDPSGVTSVKPGTGLQATLRHYQSDGVRWLYFMTSLGLGACLADDMGLGKTIQVIDLLLQLKRQSVPRRRQHKQLDTSTSLLIVPASLIGNWKSELDRFAPSLAVCFLHSSEAAADRLSEIAADPVASMAGYDLAITTYGLARRSSWMAEVPWRLVVLDEAQAIKNASAAQTKAIKKIPASGRIVLTGTPVENHLGDLWSIFDFCCPGLLGSATQFKKFVSRLSKQQDGSAFGSLRRLVRPYILRRLKTDPSVAPDLPEKTEMAAWCGLSKKQAVLYERAVRDLKSRLESSDQTTRRGIVLAMLMQLKQICNHPSQYLNEGQFEASDSGKFRRLAELCEEVVSRQEKMLLFTQFQSLCDPLATYLADLFGRSGLVLTGKTPVRKRSELVRQFQADGGPPFFVISLKAGGSGLNLTAASHVVHFDRWWNPAVENQATDRAFRIGQTRNVLVHKLISRGTLEEQIDQMIQGKQELADELLAQGGETRLTEMQDEELLKFVAIDLTRAAIE